MTEETYKYCEHKTYGVGAAQLTKYRKDARDDLFMVTFQSQGFDNKWFMPRHYFTTKGEIEFIDEAVATRLYKEGRDNPKKKRTKTVQKREKNIADILDSLF
jgi:hypothetical protein